MEYNFVNYKKFLMPGFFGIANAWPIGYFAMQKWLQIFAYKMNVGLWVFVPSAAISFFIATLTPVYQSVKAFFVNPAEILRYE
jgi:putative ABC transport system permease protein